MMVDRRCATMTVVHLPLRLCSEDWMASSVRESSALVASSRTSTAGRCEAGV